MGIIDAVRRALAPRTISYDDLDPASAELEAHRRRTDREVQEQSMNQLPRDSQTFTF